MKTEITIEKEIRFMNVGEDPPNPPPHWIGMRQWEACKDYNFLSAGQHPKFSRQLLNIEIGDIIAAFITGCGYVGLGRVNQIATPINLFKFEDKTISDFNIPQNILDDIFITDETIIGMGSMKKSLFRNAYNENTEYVIGINWIETVTKTNAYWLPNYGLFANPNIQCRLKRQVKTLNFLEDKFNIKFR